MKLEPSYPLLWTARSAPLAFDVVDAEEPRPQPIIGRATFVRWQGNNVVVYALKVQQGDRYLVGELPIKHPCSKRKQPQF